MEWQCRPRKQSNTRGLRRWHCSLKFILEARLSISCLSFTGHLPAVTLSLKLQHRAAVSKLIIRRRNQVESDQCMIGRKPFSLLCLSPALPPSQTALRSSLLGYRMNGVSLSADECLPHVALAPLSVREPNNTLTDKWMLVCLCLLPSSRKPPAVLAWTKRRQECRPQEMSREVSVDVLMAKHCRST